MRPRRQLGIVIVVTTLLGGCGAGIGPTRPPASGAAVTATPGAVASQSPVATTALGTATSGATAVPSGSAVPPRPPDARLAVEGGDPVTGELGTYVWHGNGSDSPWLPGAPMRAGPGEPLTLTLADSDAVVAWRARVVPATQTDAAGARILGEGRGTPTFAGPGIGRWTVVVEVTFPGAAGTASYAWQLQVG